jgi:putative oxidoreductase
LWASYEPAASSRWTILIRIAVGVVFTSEGLQKLIFPEALGAGRFAKIGIPAPELMGPFVGVVETTCGVLVLAGAFTRLAVVPLMTIMLVALASTKLPILLGHGYLGFASPAASKTGIWSMLHEARTDLAMLPFGDDTLAVDMDALSLLCRLAASVPPPRFHTVKYAGVLAPASAWRARIRPHPEPIAQLAEPCDVEPSSDSRSCYRGWAELLKRTFEIDVLQCPSCGGRMKLIAWVTEPKSIAGYLTKLSEPIDVPARAREPRPSVLDEHRPAPQGWGVSSERLNAEPARARARRFAHACVLRDKPGDDE